MARFEVVEAEHPADAKPRWAVRDTKHDLIVANFATREEASTHAERLERGPFDWSEQEKWKDEDDEWGDWAEWD
jgi:hypothetical protein